MGSCPRCRTNNPDGAAFCRKCGVRLTPAPAANFPPPPPQVVYVNQPATGQRVEVIHKYKKSGIGCGTVLLLLIVGCCVWGYFVSPERRAEQNASPPAPQSIPGPAPHESPAVPEESPAHSNSFPFQPPPAQEREEYKTRVVAKVDAMVEAGTVQIDIPRRAVYFNSQIWETKSLQEKRAEWEAFREYFLIKAGSRDLRILSSNDGRDLGSEVR